MNIEFSQAMSSRESNFLEVIQYFADILSCEGRDEEVKDKLDEFGIIYNG